MYLSSFYRRALPAPQPGPALGIRRLLFCWLWVLPGLLVSLTAIQAKSGTAPAPGKSVSKGQLNNGVGASVTLPQRGGRVTRTLPYRHASASALGNRPGDGTRTATGATTHRPAVTGKARSSSPDYQPLVDLYNATNGPGWGYNGGWLSDYNPCGWFGVRCDENERVTGLNLSSNQLSGTIPASLSALTNLQTLYFFDNQLTGSIPASLGTLTNLQFLDLDGNQLTGSIPASLSALTNLQSLYLNNNQLTGSIPASLGGLTNLYQIDLNTNLLSGGYPTSLKVFCGIQNYFAGNPGLPDGGSVAGFDAFCATGFSSNLAVSITANPSLTINQGSSTQLTASGADTYRWSTNETTSAISVSVAGPYSVTGTTAEGVSNIATATVTVNAAPAPLLTAGTDSGSITACQGTASAEVQSFTVAGTNLTTNIVATAPTGFEISASPASGFGASLTLTQNGGNVASTTLYVRSAATATGSISGTVVLTAAGANMLGVALEGTVNPGSPDYQPLVDLYNATNGPGWTNKTGWLTDCTPCGWYGVTCDGNGRVTGLNLSGNQLSGSIPDSLSALTNLQQLYLFQNQLSGSIPASLGALTNLQRLDLSSNQLNESIPASLSALTNLEYIYLGYNQLSESIPASLSALTNLQYLNLAGNQLSGPLPASLGALANLKELYLHANQLSGSIPASLGALTNLQQLYLNNNQLSGSIPASLSALTNLQTLSFYDNQLTGSIPASLGTLTNLQIIYLSQNQLSGCYPASLKAFCGIQNYFAGNPGLPDGGSVAGFDAFCATGFSSNLAVSITANPSLGITQGSSVQLTASGADTYRWSTDETTSAISVSVAGPYSVTATTAEGCSNTATATVTVNVPPGPTLTAGMVSGRIIACQGTVSAEVQSFTVAGTNLTTDIVAATPTGFEISASPASDFGASLTLTQSGGSVDSTTLYVRSAATATGSISGTVVLTATGANMLGVALEGTVNPLSPDYQPLVDLYNATNGPGWRNKAGWLTDCTPCGWYGVTCDESGRVTKINLDYNQLSGSIPASLSTLSNLREFSLTNNQLSGSIPTSLGVLTTLQYLSLESNRLSDSIPASLSALTNLRYLSLAGNQLSGSIPASLGALTNLKELYLNGNELSGSIPASLSSLTNLQYLYLFSNQLSGSIPASLGALTSLEFLSLSDNQLSGSIPASLSALSSLQRFYLQNNQLSLSIPASLGALTSLQQLYLQDNQLSGSIPASLGALTSLQQLDLQNNHLSGSIPASLSALNNLQYLHLFKNQLSGSIPASLSALTSLRELYLFSNQLSGSIPASLGALTSLQELYLFNNQLSGCYPAGLATFCGINANFSGNPALPDGGSYDGFAAFCATGFSSNLAVSITANPSIAITQGSSVQLTASGADTYTWSTDEITNAISVSVAGPYSVTGTTAEGCSNTATATVTVNTTTTCDASTWTARSAAEANEWNSVAYGNGQFVAVATDGTNRVMTSPDGITWTPRTAAQASEWKSVTYGMAGGNPLFVAVAQSGTNRAMTSPDGITWTARSAAEANVWASVTYGNGLFVAVANSGANRVMTSPDGITWTPRMTPEANVWASVTYGNGQFVAVAINGSNQVMTSPDGITWTGRSAAEANQWLSVAYGNGLFVAVANTGTNRVMTSRDGITWTAQTAAEANGWISVTYGNGQFVAVAYKGTNRVMTSPDGTIWVARKSSEDNSWYSVTYGMAGGNPQFVAVATDGNNQVMTACDAPACSLTVAIAAMPSLTLTSGGSVTLTASGADSYTWSNGSTQNPLIVSNITSATTLSVTGVTGTCSATASVAVSVTTAACGYAGLGNIELTGYEGSGNCHETDLYGMYIPAELYNGVPQWRKADGARIRWNGTAWEVYSSQSNSVIETNTTGSRTFLPATGWSNNNGCTPLVLTGATGAILSNGPSVSIAPISQTITSGGSVTLTASGADSYTWSNGSTQNPLIVSNITSAITLSVTGMTGTCSATASVAVSVTQPAPANFCNTVVYVTESGNGQKNGSSWANALAGPDLAPAVASACASTTFLVANGLYKPTTSTTDRTASFSIASGVEVYGGYAVDNGVGTRGAIDPTTGTPSSTTFSGDIDGNNTLDDGNSYHVVWMQNVGVSTRLDGLVIMNGKASGSPRPASTGGGIYNEAKGNGQISSPIISNCLLTNHDSPRDRAGAMYNSGNGGTASPMLINCVFRQNTGYAGAALYNDGYLGISSPTLTNCIFTNNTATRYGGAIFNNGYAGVTSMTAINCRFSENLAQNGGAVCTDGCCGFSSGKGVASSSSPVFQSCTFTANRASATGGAMYTDGSYEGESRPILTDCVFASNTAGAGGGAIYATGEESGTCVVGISGSTFTNNVATGSDGGAIYSLSAVIAIQNSSLTDNQSGNNGGAIYSSSGGLQLTNVIAERNQATGSNGGGALYSTAGSVTITGSSISRNTASSNGGAIKMASSSRLAISNSVLNQNQLSGLYGSGGAIDNGPGCTLTLESTTLAQNSSNYNGGAINNNNDAVATLTNCVLSSNSAKGSSGAGGAVYNANNTVTRFAGSTFTGNLSLANIGGKGGAIYNNFVTQAIITDCAFEQNVAPTGGAVYNAGSSASYTLTASTFTNNTATASGFSSGGGAIVNDYVTIDLTNCRFVGNVASNGGAVKNSGGIPNVLNSYFERNQSVGTDSNNDGGGALNQTGQSVTSRIESSTFVQNTAMLKGGGVWATTYGVVSLTNCTFASNTAPAGGGAYLNGNFPAISNSRFTQNSAATGGALYFRNGFNGMTPIRNSLFSRNTASSGGGAIYAQGTSLTVVNGSFSGNTAPAGTVLDMSTSFVLSGALVNSIIWSNGSVANNFTLGSGTSLTLRNSIADPGSSTYTDGGSNKTLDPGFTSAASDDLTVSGCSPAINAGTTALNSTSTDLAGNARVFGGTIDMGAYEYQSAPTALTVTIAATPSLTLTSGGSVTLTALGATSYTWSNGSTQNPLIVSNITSATTLSVTGITGTCSATATAQVSVTAVISCDASTWTASTAAEANSWRSVTYGNGLFVAVSYDGTNRVMTSPDGSTWTVRTAAEPNSWRSVTYGNGQFVAVAENGINRVMTSPDGITWTPRTAAQANLWTSVTYGNGLFVAVAENGTNQVMTSPDGITWTGRTAARANLWNSVTYGNGLFVAVAQYVTNQVMTSPDGITWTAQTTPQSNYWYSVTYGNGLFVAVASNGTNRVMTSPDGITWTVRTAAEANLWRSVTYSNGLFVAVALIGTNRVMTSPDGLTWTARTTAEANFWNSVTYGNGLFVAVASSGTNRVMTSCYTPTATPAITLGTVGGTATGCVGMASSTQSFTVSGNNLTDNLLATAPAGFELSTNATTGFASLLTLAPSGGAVASTTLFVRTTAGATMGTQTGTVVLTSAGATSQSADVSATVNAPPLVSITATPSLTVNSGQSTTLTASGATTYLWSNGATTATTTVNVAAPYSVTGTTSGCSSTTSVTLFQRDCQTTVTASAIVACVDKVLSLTATAQSQVSQPGIGSPALGVPAGPVYSWVAPSGATLSSTSSSVISASFTTTGVKTFTATVTTSEGCVSTNTVSVIVNALPTPAISGNLTICAGQSTTLTASGGSSYVWSNGGSTAASTVSPVSTTAYSVTVTNASGCVSSTSVSVTVNPLPLPTLTALPSTTLTGGLATTLVAGSSGAPAVSYVFSGTGLTSQSPATGIATANQAGVYSVTLTTASGCTASTSLTLTLPTPLFTGCGSPTATLGQPLQIIEPAYNCTTGLLQFRTLGGDGSPITYSAIGVTSGTSSCTAYLNAEVAQDIRDGRANVAPFTLVVQQGGLRLTYSWNALATCASQTVSPNQAPIAPVISEQTAQTGVSFSFTVPVFTDPNGDALTYTVVGLPANGLRFNADSRLISGTPSLTGVVSLTAIASDPAGLSASAAFRISVVAPVSGALNVAPVAPAITGQSAVVGQAFVLAVPSFSDANGDALVYTALGLPANGLSFDATSRLISGTPSTTGVLSVTIKATDPGGLSATTSFSLFISASAVTGGALTLQQPLYDCQTGAFSFRSSGGDGSGIEYRAVGITDWSSRADGFTVLPASDAGPFQLQARQRGVTVSLVFDWKGYCAGPKPPVENQPPVAPLIGNQTATVGQFFTMTIPAFPDANGDVLSYGLTQVPPSGLSFNVNTRVLSGTPSVTGVIGISVLVTDPGGLTAVASFSITVGAPVVTAPIAPVLPSQTATVGVLFSYVVPAFSGTAPLVYSISNLPAGLSFDNVSRLISGTTSGTGVSTVVISASNVAGQASGQFTLTVSASAVTPTGPATLTITSFSCAIGADGSGSVAFVAGYSNGTFSPSVPPLFINGVTASGVLGQAYTFRFDGGVTSLFIADNASRSLYFTWDFRSACAGPVTPPQPPVPTAPVAPVLVNQTATVGNPFSYVVPTFSGTAPISYSATGLPTGLSFNASSRTISGTPSLTGISTVVISASNVAGQASGQFTLTVSASAVTPTGPATLTITSFSCTIGANGGGSVNLVVGYTDGSFAPALPPLFINGVTASGQLGQTYTVNFDGNQRTVSIQDQASRSTYFVWDYRAACGSRNGRLGVETVHPWQAVVVGNPPVDEYAQVALQHAEGQTLQLRVSDLSGHAVSTQSISVSEANQRVQVRLGESGGVYLLQVSDGLRQQTLRLLRP